MPEPADRQACTDCPATPQACRHDMRADALRNAPGDPVLLLRPAPVEIRSMPATAIAYTVTHVLVEWDGGGDYHVRWEASWLVRRVEPPQAGSLLREAT